MVKSITLKIVKVDKIDNKDIKVKYEVLLVNDDDTTEKASGSKTFKVHQPLGDIEDDLVQSIKDEYSSIFAHTHKKEKLEGKEYKITI